MVREFKSRRPHHYFTCASLLRLRVLATRIRHSQPGICPQRGRRDKS